MGKAAKRAPPAREPSSSDSESSYEFRVLKKNTAVAGAKPKKSAKPAPPPESSGEDDGPALSGDVGGEDVAEASDSDDNVDGDEDSEEEEGSEEEDSESEDDDAKPAPAKAKAVVKPAVKPVLPTASKTKAAEE